MAMKKVAIVLMGYKVERMILATCLIFHNEMNQMQNLS